LFEDVRAPHPTAKFFMHWYWRTHAHVGLVHAWLQSGRIGHARVAADEVTESARGIGDPNLQALAWDARAHVAMAEAQLTAASEYLDRAFASLARFDVPISAWRVHATASELYRRLGHSEDAVIHRERARAHITALADSFGPEEPLRVKMLAAPAVRRVCEDVLELGL